MEIEIAQEVGLCFGVRRAIKLVTKAASEYGKIETLGPVAHNEQLVQQLEEAGVRAVADLDQVSGEAIAISTHGVGPDVLAEIESRKLHVIDITCPIVKKAQLCAARLARAGFTVIIFGETEHSEVKGLLGWTKGKGITAMGVEQIAIPKISIRTGKAKEAPKNSENSPGGKQSPLLSRLGIISQTTQNKDSFVAFANQVITAFAPKVSEIRIINTLCRAIQRRLEEAVKLARRNQLIIVIGGHNSANTKRLAEACAFITDTHLVETAAEIDKSWLSGRHHVGITAGASTPDEAIQEVAAKLNSLAKLVG